MAVYRPWGILDWALGLSAPKRWTFVGALGTEERSLAAWGWLRSLGAEDRHVLLEIHDNVSSYTSLTESLLALRLKEFLGKGGDAESIKRYDLLAELYQIQQLATAAEANSISLLLDITSLPKRFFFPLLRAFYRSSAVRNLMVTYTAAESYQESEPLSKNPQGWAPLPGFPSAGGQRELLIASIGFAVEGLLDHADAITSSPAIKVLIPFPASLSPLRLSWESVWHLEKDSVPGKFENHRVSPSNMSMAFDRIVSLSRDSSYVTAFAPFGPKPISAAMCLYALQKDCAVYYPQPLIYHPQYSFGVGKDGGKDAVYGYWIKHEGEALYSVD